MPRTSSKPFGTLSNLSRLVRSALVIDGLLATGRRWEDIELEVRVHQYQARGFAPPRRDVVRRYFSLEIAPGLDPGYRSPLGYPCALALQYPQLRPTLAAPLLDLLFGLDLPKRNQMELKQRFSSTEIKAKAQQGQEDDAEFMQVLNQIAPGRRHGRASDQPFRPLWSLYQTMLLGRSGLVNVLFEEGLDGFNRRIRVIEDELVDLVAHGDIDALGLLYGLVLEALEFADKQRLRAAKTATLEWLPNLHRLPECRRVAPLLELAVRRACDQAVPRQFNRTIAYDRVLPGSWRDPGPLVSIPELAYGFPTNDDSLKFRTLRELNIERLGAQIEERAVAWLAVPASERHARKASVRERRAAKFPFRSKSAQPLKTLHAAVLTALPDIDGWRDGRFWMLQRGTRCAIAASGQESFPMMLVDFGHVRGDPVTDRPIRAMPWLLADRLWVEPVDDLERASQVVIKFLKMK